MKQILLWGAFALILAGILVINANREEKAAAASSSGKPVIRLGAIYSLTGSAQTLGTQLRQSSQLRIDEQNARPGMFDYKIFFEDDQTTNMQAVLAYRKLVNVDKCDVIYSNWTGQAFALAPLAAKDQKMIFNISWDEQVTKGHPLSFIDCTQPAPQVKLLAETLQALGVKKVAIIYMIQQGAIAASNEFVKIAPAFGMEPKTITFNPGERDFRGHLLKFYDYNADAYIAIGFGTEFEILIRRIKETGTKAYITTVENYSFCTDLAPYNGRFYTEGNQPTDEYAKRFEAGTKQPAIGYTGLGYDMVDLTIYAYETAGKKLGRKPTTEEAAAVLRTIKDYPAAIGPISMSAHQVVQSAAVLKYIENGKTIPLTIEELKEKLKANPYKN